MQNDNNSNNTTKTQAKRRKKKKHLCKTVSLQCIIMTLRDFNAARDTIHFWREKFAVFAIDFFFLELSPL